MKIRATLATLIASYAAHAQKYLSQEAAYVRKRHSGTEAPDVQANPRVGAGPRATDRDDVVTGNRVIGGDPDLFICGEILRHNDSG